MDDSRHVHAKTPVRNLKLTFDVVQPDGNARRVELAMPEGAICYEVGREYPEPFYRETEIAVGQSVIRLHLLPMPTLDEANQAKLTMPLR